MTSKEINAILAEFRFCFKDEPGLAVLNQKLSADTILSLISACTTGLTTQNASAKLKEMVRLAVIYKHKTRLPKDTRDGSPES